MKNLLNPDISAGKIVIADPFSLLFEKCYKRSVILLGSHGSKGTVGFILNKPSDLLLEDALEDFPFEIPVFYGGPIETDTIRFLHTRDKDLGNADTKKIMDGLWQGGDLDKLRILLETDQIGEGEIRFFAGHTLWKPNQLKEELTLHPKTKVKLWTLSSGKKDFIFTHPEKIWKEAWHDLESPYEVLANFEEDPSLN